MREKKPKSRIALLREQNRLAALRYPFLRKKRLLFPDEMATFAALSSSYQAISWALDDNAQAPSKCYAPRKAKR